ncbi:hypothetical protein JCM1840_003337 [Sporobolomyces johnsonii]
MDMSGMGTSSGMSMGSGSGSSSTTEAACKISMMWNWYTIDACFLSKEWHIRSKGGYAGSIIGVFFMVVALECVRRLSRDYDRQIRMAYYKREEAALAAVAKNSGKDEVATAAPFRPSMRQQLVRACFYGVQFGTSYILMLLAMYFNGGLILAIMAGGFVGFFISARDTANVEAAVDDAAVRGECCC